ncbi:IS630 family transposase [Rhizophagus clarus]|uniref:IS630 family transposase n=1 Tax=Rhizophagus clarus TaxID=94130 RepID=A0A8H3L838_9GLOM|nr:IS630 family transposase [Rhizophagus clarus]
MLDGFVAVDIFEGICNKQRFVDFVLNQVVPVINPYSSNNSIIIMDNVKIHYDTDFISLLEASGLRFLDDGYGRNESFSLRFLDDNHGRNESFSLRFLDDGHGRNESSGLRFLDDGHRRN